ncbi:MAG: alanyl-tRNA editing protein [Tumebacillaceae bacterium]
MTRKLYYEDAYIKDFHAAIVEQGVEENGTPFVVLDQTAFYPVGGGQPCDLGTINGVEVVDVEEVDGRILHRLASALTETTGQAFGALDWARRVDLTQQHTGQHIFSAAFEQLYNGETVGFHLGRETVKVEIDMPDMTQEMVDQVEFLTNHIIMEGREILARFVTAEELAAMPLHKAPSVTENVRIVSVKDFDNNPCGGTHFTRTSEVGPVKVLSWERYKGHIRFDLVCGWRALNAMTEKQLILRTLSRQLTSAENELPDSVARLQNENKENVRALNDAKTKLQELEVGELLAAAESKHAVKLVAKTFPDRPMQELQRLAQQIIDRDSAAVALLISSGAKKEMVFARGADVQVAMNELIKETLPLVEGKGGGNAKIAQGGGAGEASAEDVLNHVLALFEAKLTQTA